jgi:hypothetical protein
MPVICWTRIPRPGRLGREWSRFLEFPIPDLSRRKVRISGQEEYSPPLLVVFTPEERESRPVPIKPAKPVAELKPKQNHVHEQRSKTVTAAKSSRKPPEENVAAIVSAPPKPLKVIRRRREEAPKVFETPPKTVPLAMLEGIAAGPNDDVEE